MVIGGGRLIAFHTKAFLRREDSCDRNASPIAAGTSGSALP
jgi:hypothetical protein